jgi:hypothetical protein
MLAAALIALGAPGAALALPAAGDVLGTDAASVAAALEAQGCAVRSVKLDDGRIEAKCRETATGKSWELYIDPVSGAVARIKSGHD